MDTIAVNGIRLAYAEAGAGPSLVWVHGGWTDHHDADLVVPPLSERYRVITYDRRGHSQSDRPPGHQGVMTHVADLAELIEQLDAAPAHLVTNSFGGEIALKLAVRQPELVASLCLYEPGLFGILGDDPKNMQAVEDVQARFGPVLADIEQGNCEVAAREFMDTVMIGPGGWDAVPEQMRQTYFYNAPTVLNDFHDPTLGSFDIDLLAELNVPVLLAGGGRSNPLFAAVLGRLADALPQARTYTFTDAGHLPELTHPDALAEVVKVFLADISAKTA